VISSKFFVCLFGSMRVCGGCGVCTATTRGHAVKGHSGTHTQAGTQTLQLPIRIMVQSGQVFGLHQDSVQVGIGQSKLEFNFFGIR
jgi:hypothetical protein